MQSKKKMLDQKSTTDINTRLSKENVDVGAKPVTYLIFVSLAEISLVNLN